MSHEEHKQYPGISNYFNSFLIAFRTPEKRLAAARKLYEFELPKVGVGERMSRIQLIARWGHTNDELHPLAEEMYGLKAKVGANAGQLALVFMRGKQEDVADSEWGLGDHIKLRLGKVAGEDLVHVAGPSTKGRVAEQPPLLVHGMRIPTRSLFEIEADVVGDPTVKFIGDEGMLPVWSGASPLVDVADIEGYRAEARMDACETIVGTEECLAVLRQLDTATNQNGAFDRYVQQLALAA